LINRLRIDVSGDTNLGKTMSAASQRDMIVTCSAGRTYPLWLSICSAITLLLVFAGFLTMIWLTTIGAAVAAVGFLGVWIFGSLASRYGESMKRVIVG
jgi:hypothetical protein